MNNPVIKTPRSKQAFREMVSNLAPFESINWQHYDNWYGVIDVTLKIEYKFGSARAAITLRYSSGNEVKFDYRDVDNVVTHLWQYRGGMTETGRFNRNLLEQACAIEELKISLESLAKLRRKHFSDFTDDEIINEARFVLDIFNEEGSKRNKALVEDEDPDMIRQWHDLRRFTARYENLLAVA